jgi:hypothetical protein
MPRGRRWITRSRWSKCGKLKEESDRKLREFDQEISRRADAMARCEAAKYKSLLENAQ